MSEEDCKDWKSAISDRYNDVSIPVMSSIAAVSLVLNACNIAIFTRRKMVSPTNSILLAIAVGDLFKVSLFLLITAARPTPSSYASQVLYLFCNVIMFLMHAFALWCGVLLALFRLFYLSFYASPLTKVWFGLSRSRLAVCLAFLANVVASAPYASVVRVKEHRLNATDGDTVDVQYEAAMLDKYEFSVRIFSSVAQKIAPCLIMTVFCVCIIRSLRQTEKRRESLAANQRQTPAASRPQRGGDGGCGGSHRRDRRSRDHRRTTRFLLIIMLLNSMYEIPMGLLLILSDRELKLKAAGCYSQEYHGILNTMGLVNNSVNFILYCFMSKQFRDVFKEVFGLDRLARKARKMMRQPASIETSAGATAAAAAAGHSHHNDAIGLGAFMTVDSIDGEVGVEAEEEDDDEEVQEKSLSCASDAVSNPCLEY